MLFKSDAHTPDKAKGDHRSKPLLKTNGMTLVHRLQRSWPMIRYVEPITELSNETKKIARFLGTPQDHMRIFVELRGVKQGKYKSNPATLLMFEVSLGRQGEMPEACLEIQIDSLPHESTKKSGLYLGAYGPQRVTEWPEPIESARASASDLPASVEIRPCKRGALVTVRPQETNPALGPEIFPFGIVVVHSERAKIQVLPSTTEFARLRAHKRTIITPIHLDLDDKLGQPIASCAHQAEGGCHSTCDDFGPDHMTPKMWEQNLTKQPTSLRHYDGNSPNTSWAGYV